MCKCILLSDTLLVVIHADLMLSSECSCRQLWWRAAKAGGTHKHQNSWQGTSYMPTWISFSIFSPKLMIFLKKDGPPTLFLFSSFNTKTCWMKNLLRDWLGLKGQTHISCGSCDKLKALRLVDSKILDNWGSLYPFSIDQESSIVKIWYA